MNYTFIVKSLWIGNRLNHLSRFCIQSFIDLGCLYHLYTYEDVQNVPAGVKIEDANSILPKSSIFTYNASLDNSPVAFSNTFRYKLLYDLGGWWVDTDVFALREFPEFTPYVFSTEPSRQDLIHAGIIKTPKACPIMLDLYKNSINRDPATLRWGEIGSALMTFTLNYPMYSDLRKFIVPPNTFCPIHWGDMGKFAEQKLTLSFHHNMYAIHLFNNMWRKKVGDVENHPVFSELLRMRDVFNARRVV